MNEFTILFEKFDLIVEIISTAFTFVNLYTSISGINFYFWSKDKGYCTECYISFFTLIWIVFVYSAFLIQQSGKNGDKILE